MAGKITMDQLFKELEERNRAEYDRIEAFRNEPEEAARRAARQAADHKRGVELGWWDEDGNSLISDEPEEDADGEDDLDDE